MAIGFLTRGAVVSIEGVRYKLQRKFDDQVWQIENIATGRLIEKSQGELLEHLRRGELEIVLDADAQMQRQKKRESAKQKDIHWNSLREEEREMARYRWRYVSKVLLVPKSKNPLKEVILQVAQSWKDDTPPSVSSVKAWMLRYIVGGRDLSALVPMERRRGNRESRYGSEIEEIVDASIDEVYLQPTRGTLEDARLYAIPQIEAENRLLPAGDERLPIPTIHYFKRRLARINKFDVCAARYGLQYAIRRFKSVLGFSRGESILDRVEIDHTPINLIVIDERSALPLGRPWLTIALDDFSRSVLGYYLSFEPPSYLSVAHCLIHALLPKTYLKEMYPKIVNSWDCYGAMQTLVVDNGPEFHAQALEDAVLRFGAEIQYCPKAAPWFKGKVERFLGTMNRGVAHGVPGTTFSTILEKEDYDSVATATVTLSALHEIIHTWIVDFYHQRRHRTLQDTPANCWTESAQSLPIPLPTQMPELEAAFAVPQERTLTNKGIELFTLFYNSDECNELLMRIGMGSRITVRYNPQDIGYVYVDEPDTGRPFKVPVTAKYREYAAGLSKWQHEVCRKYALRHMGGQSDIIALADAKARIAAIVEEQIFRKRSTLRKQAARYQRAGTSISSQREAAMLPDDGAVVEQSGLMDFPRHEQNETASLTPMPISATQLTFVPRGA